MQLRDELSVVPMGHALMVSPSRKNRRRKKIIVRITKNLGVVSVSSPNVLKCF